MNYPFDGDQVHDFNPGFIGSAPSGVFWTQAVDPSSIQANVDAGTASFELDNLPIDDWGVVSNGVSHANPPIPSIVSFKMNWSGIVAQLKQNNASEGFRGNY